VPLLVDAENPQHVKQLEKWMKSYKAEELFDKMAGSIRTWRNLRQRGDRRMGANPHANGGLLLRDCACPTSTTML